jgi:hypothetical protein
LGGSLVLSYAVLGFVLMPAALKAQLPSRLGKLLGRVASVDKVRVNPFTLSLILEGFLVKDSVGEAFVGWQRPFANVQLSTLLTRTVSLKANEWTEPYGRVVLRGAGSAQLHF